METLATLIFIMFMVTVVCAVDLAAHHGRWGPKVKEKLEDFFGSKSLFERGPSWKSELLTKLEGIEKVLQELVTETKSSRIEVDSVDLVEENTSPPPVPTEGS